MRSPLVFALAFSALSTLVTGCGADGGGDGADTPAPTPLGQHVVRRPAPTLDTGALPDTSSPSSPPASFDTAHEASGANPPQTPLTDHGGRVVPGIRFYLVMWGTGFEPTTKSLYTTFLKGLGASPYFATDTQYLRGAKNTAAWAATYADTTSNPPATTTDAMLRAEISALLASGALPYDANGLYFVATPKKAKVCYGSSCSCTQFCGYHSAFTDTHGIVLYSSIPSAAACPTSCGVFANDASSPNTNVEADEGVSVIAHEAEETQSDAYGSAWYDASGYENGDKCAYRYGTTTAAPNGAPVNQAWGTKSWLIQTNWSNAAAACVQKTP